MESESIRMLRQGTLCDVDFRHKGKRSRGLRKTIVDLRGPSWDRWALGPRGPRLGSEPGARAAATVESSGQVSAEFPGSSHIVGLGYSWAAGGGQGWGAL